MGKRSFPGTASSSFSDIARTGNRGSIQEYQSFGEIPVDCLIEAFFKTLVPDYRVSCPKSGTGDCSGLKTGLTIPNWLANRSPDGLEHREAAGASFLIFAFFQVRIRFF
ncbi:MAG TPA: hypothetical protein VJ350_04085 [Methanoregula sp.]|nr:hypothetical protein [Methanoregula sp.]